MTKGSHNSTIYLNTDTTFLEANASREYLYGEAPIQFLITNFYESINDQMDLSYMASSVPGCLGCNAAINSSVTITIIVPPQQTINNLQIMVQLINLTDWQLPPVSSKKSFNAKGAIAVYLIGVFILVFFLYLRHSNAQRRKILE